MKTINILLLLTLTFPLWASFNFFIPIKYVFWPVVLYLGWIEGEYFKSTGHLIYFIILFFLAFTPIDFILVPCIIVGGGAFLIIAMGQGGGQV